MQFRGFPTDAQQMRYYYNTDGVFVSSSTDSDMAQSTLPYVVKPKGWSSCDYKMVDGELVHTPKPRNTVTR